MRSDASPGFSIVVATFGRVELLEELLVSLERARARCPAFAEVLLADDSPGEDAGRIRALADRYDAVYLPIAGAVSHKRNRGVEEARGEIIWFVDSDCVVTEEALCLYGKLFQNSDTVSAAGPLRFFGDGGWFWESIEATPFLKCFELPAWLPALEWAVTANMAVRRDAFLEVGGFDESFPHPAGEDVDLGLRLVSRFGAMIGCPEALVLHKQDSWNQPGPMYRRLRYYGAADFILVSKHPDRAVHAVPRRTLIYATLLVCGLAGGLAVRSPIPFAIACGLVVAENVAVSLYMSAGPARQKGSFLRQMVAQSMIHWNEIAYVWACVRAGRPGLVNMQMVYYVGQYQGMLRAGRIVAAVHLAALGALALTLVAIAGAM